MDFTVYKLTIEPRARFLTPLRGDLLLGYMIKVFAQGIVGGDFADFMIQLSASGAEVIVSDPFYTDGECFLGNVNSVYQTSTTIDKLKGTLFDIDIDALRTSYGSLSRDYFGIEPFILPLTFKSGALSLTKDKKVLGDLQKIFFRDDYMRSPLSLLVAIGKVDISTVTDMLSAVGRYGYGARSSAGYGRFNLVDFVPVERRDLFAGPETQLKVNLSSIDRPLGTAHYFRRVQYHGAHTNGEVTHIDMIGSGGFIVDFADNVHIGNGLVNDSPEHPCYMQRSSLLLPARFDNI